jgi:hypothetical protein
MPRAPRRSLAVLGGVLALPLAGGVLAGCGSGSSTSSAAAAGGAQGAPTPATTTVTRTVTPAPTQSASSRPSSSGPASGGPAATAPRLLRCDGPTLTVTVGPADGAAGSVYRTIVFRNGGATTCTLQGYPGVAAADVAGKAVVDARRDPSRPTTRVVLGPGASAHAVLRARNLPAGSAACETYPQLLVTPPDSRRTTTLPVAVTPCERVFVVGPVAAGSSA